MPKVGEIDSEVRGGGRVEVWNTEDERVLIVVPTEDAAMSVREALRLAELLITAVAEINPDLVGKLARLDARMPKA